jgi:hypothetical protein
MEHPSAQPGPDEADEVVRHDYGGWISGPCLGTKAANALAAEHAALTRLAAQYPDWTVWRRGDGRWIGECRPTETSFRYLTAPTAAELEARIEAECTPS